MTRRLNLALLVFLVFFAIPFAWLMLNASTLGTVAKPLTIEQLRGLAASLRGEGPTQVRYEVIGRRRVISDLLAAGSGLRPVPFVIRAYELVMADSPAVTIDRGMSRIVAQRHRIRDFDPAAQAGVEHAVSASKVALVLAPDVHHSGRSDALADMGSGLGGERRDLGGAPYAIAAGVVVVPTYGIRPGERMVYVRLRDGHELLFTGDVAPIDASWIELRPPARVVTTFFVGDDRDEIAAWLRTIQALKTASPGLQIVSGHGSMIPRIISRGFVADPHASGSKRR